MSGGVQMTQVKQCVRIEEVARRHLGCWKQERQHRGRCKALYGTES